MKDKMDENIISKEVLAVIRSKYGQIFAAEQRVADFVLAYPGETVNCNVSQLAKASGVSDATVVRMCRHLGYTGYYQFRITLSRDLGKEEQAKELLLQDQGNLSRIFNEYVKTVVDIGKSLDEAVLRKCIALLKTAETVYVLGIGNASNLSQYMGFRLERLGIRSVYDHVPEYMINHINLAKEDAVLLAISKSGISKPVIRGIELAKDRGMQVVSITAVLDSPVAEMADCLLLTSVEEPPFSVKASYTYLNEIVVMEALLEYFEKLINANNKERNRPEIVLAEYKI